jgi:hypothetical protein
MTLAEYIDWVALRAGMIEGIALEVAGTTDDERCRLFVERMLAMGLAQRVCPASARGSTPEFVLVNRRRHPWGAEIAGSRGRGDTKGARPPPTPSRISPRSEDEDP